MPSAPEAKTITGGVASDNENAAEINGPAVDIMVLDAVLVVLQKRMDRGAASLAAQYDTSCVENRRHWETLISHGQPHRSSHCRIHIIEARTASPRT